MLIIVRHYVEMPIMPFSMLLLPVSMRMLLPCQPFLPLNPKQAPIPIPCGMLLQRLISLILSEHFRLLLMPQPLPAWPSCITY